MVDVNTLRSMRNQDFSKLTKEFENESNASKGSFKDERFWVLERDKTGNATATIRFLPCGEGDELPWVKLWTHGFKGPGGRWYIENSLTTINKPDPVSELNQKLWNSTTDDKSPERKQARDQKRKLNFISNILVISDPKNSENNGKVFLFKYGKKIFDKIMDKARPTFEDEQPVNVFDYWEGANFKIRVKTVDRFPNYDSSVFETPTQVAKTDDDILAIAKMQYKLKEFTDPTHFKSYDQLKTKLHEVLSGFRESATAENTNVDDDVMTTESTRASAAAPTVGKTKSAPAARAVVSDEDDQDMEAFFKELAESDD